MWSADRKISEEFVKLKRITASLFITQAPVVGKSLTTNRPISVPNSSYICENLLNVELYHESRSNNCRRRSSDQLSPDSTYKSPYKSTLCGNSYR